MRTGSEPVLVQREDDPPLPQHPPVGAVPVEEVVGDRQAGQRRVGSAGRGGRRAAAAATRRPMPMRRPGRPEVVGLGLDDRFGRDPARVEEGLAGDRLDRRRAGAVGDADRRGRVLALVLARAATAGRGTTPGRRSRPWKPRARSVCDGSASSRWTTSKIMTAPPPRGDRRSGRRWRRWPAAAQPAAGP